MIIHMVGRINVLMDFRMNVIFLGDVVSSQIHEKYQKTCRLQDCRFDLNAGVRLYYYIIAKKNLSW